MTSHGMKGTVEYTSYLDAKQRCNNENNKHYKNYGGRGIMFLFKSFEEFYEELGNKPSSAYQLDRIDNDGNYERGNVRWATREQNISNRRCSKVYV